jgi:AcrR family transcriptional regulator
MVDPVKPHRAYDSSRRQEHARQNRTAILEAARRQFLEHGYAATTIGDVAEEAGVSAPTVYKVFANKPGLLKAVVDVAIVGDDEPVPLMEREFVRRNIAEPDPRKKLADYAAHFRVTAARSMPLTEVARQAAAADPTAADVYGQLQRERLTGMAAFAQHLKAGKHLRRGVTADDARDVLWAYTSPELYDLLVTQRGWSPARFERWQAEALIAALLPPADPGAPAPSGSPR